MPGMNGKETAVCPCKNQYAYVFVMFSKCNGDHWVCRICDVLHKIAETTGTDAHTELYRMPYRIK